MFPQADNTLLTDREPPEIVIFDDVTDCPYIEGQIARLPIRLPIRVLEPSEFDERLAKGDRRHGVALYTPSCPACRACEPIRLDLERFRLQKTHRRILRQGDQRLQVEVGPPILTMDRIQLYEKHQQGRGLSMPDHPPMTLPRYRGFIVDRLCDSFEIRLYLSGELVGVAITDRARDSLSAHYTFFDPDFPKLSLGTYAILKQIEMARQQRKRYLYLGLYIAENKHMRYKARFLPHERRVQDAWTRFEA